MGMMRGRRRTKGRVIRMRSQWGLSVPVVFVVIVVVGCHRRAMGMTGTTTRRQRHRGMAYVSALATPGRRLRATLLSPPLEISVHRKMSQKEDET